MTIANANYYLSRVELAHRGVGALTELAIDANRHSEQIAELLLVGEGQRPETPEARD